MPVVAFVVVFVVTVMLGAIERVPLALAIDSELSKSNPMFTGVPDASVIGNGEVVTVVDTGLNTGARVHVVVTVGAGAQLVVPSVKVFVELFSTVMEAVPNVIIMLLYVPAGAEVLARSEFMV